MSVRAYKVELIDLKDEPTFNLWHDEGLMDRLNNLIYCQLNEDGCGMVSFYKGDIKNLIKKEKDKEVKKQLEVI